MIRVTRKYRFSSSHRLHATGLSDAENAVLYGKCNNPYGHGHDYEIEVSARGPLEPRSGRAIDPAALDRLVEEQVLRPFDHKYLNTESAAFQQVGHRNAWKKPFVFSPADTTPTCARW